MAAIVDKRWMTARNDDVSRLDDENTGGMEKLKGGKTGEREDSIEHCLKTSGGLQAEKA